MILAVFPGVALIALVLWDVFEVIVLPRRVERTVRPARYFYRSMWRVWSIAIGRIGDAGRRENLLGLFGPLFLLMLFVAWSAVLVCAYALMYLSIGDVTATAEDSGFGTDLYFSGTTFFTLGLGDVTPDNGAAQSVTVLEAATGFGFLALVVGYLPTFYQSFSRREVDISLLDARAGSPPTAGELLRRFSSSETAPGLAPLLGDWERWSAALLESHLSYPALMFFRSQHERQSWVAALTAILDISAVLMTRAPGVYAPAAKLTFAMARHTAVDLSALFERTPRAPESDRLPPHDYERLQAILVANPLLADRDPLGNELSALRATYEPYVSALSRYLMMPLPPWVPADRAIDDWQTSPDERLPIGLADPVRDSS